MRSVENSTKCPEPEQQPEHQERMEMILTVASYKGGVGKTTTAIHLAAYLNTLAPALLLDGDSTKSAIFWSRKDRLGFRVASIEQAAKLVRDYKHIVIDTGQKPSSADLEAAADGCDLLVVPAVPADLDTDGLVQTVRALQALKSAKFKVLLTRVAPDEAGAAAELRECLRGIGVAVFVAEIPRLKAFGKAAGAGVTVQQADDRNADRAWACYAAVGLELGA